MLDSIEIRLQPETWDGDLWYFWVVFGRSAGGRHNMGFGWETSVEAAAKEAVAYYRSAAESQ